MTTQTTTPAVAVSSDSDLIRRLQASPLTWGNAAAADNGDLAATISADVINNWQAATAAFLASLDIAPASRAVYATGLNAFGDHLRLTRPVIITPAVIADWRDTILAAGQRATTVRNYLLAVKRIFAHFAARSIMPDVAADIRLPKVAATHRRLPLTQQQAQTLAAAVTAADRRADERHLRDAVIVLLALYGGLRTIEIARARIGDYATRAGQRILAVHGKGKADSGDDFIVLTDTLNAAITRYLRARRLRNNGKPLPAAAPLITSLSNRNGGDPVTTVTVSTTIKTALLSVGIDDPAIVAHSLRHTAACAILNGGGSIEQAQETLRHASINTTQIYTHAVRAERRLQNGGEHIIEEYLRKTA